jgi:hypothetical protein
MARHGNRDCTIGGSRHISAPCTMSPLTRHQKPEPWNKSGRAKAVAWRFLGVLSQVPSHCGRLRPFTGQSFSGWSTSALSFASASAPSGWQRSQMVSAYPSRSENIRSEFRTLLKCLHRLPRNRVIAANAGPSAASRCRARPWPCCSR